MKKTLTILLAALLALAALPPALAAEQYRHEASGIVFTVPDGFVAEDISEEGLIALLVMDENDENLVYAYEVFYEEALDGVWLEDLDAERVQAVATA